MRLTTRTLLMSTIAIWFSACSIDNSSSSSSTSSVGDSSTKRSVIININDDYSQGEIDYPDLNCSGMLVLIEKEENKRYVFEEILTENSNACIEFDRLILTIDNGVKEWKWILNEEEVEVDIEVDDDNTTTPSTDNNSSITDTHPNYITAKSNGLEDVSIQFNGLTVTVTTNTPLTDVSSSTIAIYGNIQGNNTNALLKLNSNYLDGTTFVVKVYKNNKLVGISEELTLGGESIHFDDIP